MQCSHCQAELVYEDTYFLGPVSNGNKLGEIYRCPNHEGFATEEEAREYQSGTNDGQPEDWEEIVCLSAVYNVSGTFYTDLQGNLHEGYPC